MPVCICPTCHSRYNIPAAKLGENGRTLRCAKCGNQFFAPPTGSPEATPLPEAPAPTPATAPLHTEVPATVPEPASLPTPEPTPAETVPLAPPMPDVVIPDLSAISAIKHQPKWFRTLLGSPLIWLGMAALAFTALAFYSVLGMLQPPPTEEPPVADINPADAINPPHLVMSDITRELTQRGDTWVLTIKGTVSNQGETDLRVPEIRVQLLDPNQMALDFWPAEIEAKTLAAGSSSLWQARFLNPPLARLASFRAYFRDATGDYAAQMAKQAASEKPVDPALKSH